MFRRIFKMVIKLTRALYRRRSRQHIKVYVLEITKAGFSNVRIEPVFIKPESLFWGNKKQP